MMCITAIFKGKIMLQALPPSYEQSGVLSIVMNVFIYTKNTFYPILFFLSTDEQERNYLCISLLPFLLRPPHINRKVKFSKREVKDSFFMRCSSQSDFRSELKKKNEDHLKAKVPIQPLPIFVGTDVKALDCYVEVNSTLYSTTSLLQAVTVCFKCFFVLNLSYPKAAEKLWTFIQNELFHIGPYVAAAPDVELLKSSLASVPLPE